MAKSIFKGTAIERGFKTDADKENKGIWREHDESGICVRVRRGSRVEHRRAVRRHFKPFAHLTTVDPKDELLVKQKAAAEELVADWGVRKPRDFDDDSAVEALDPVRAKELGQVVPLENEDGEIRPTVENVLEAFKEMPDFYQWVAEEADTFEHYRLSAMEDASGNSPGSSSGTANGGSPEPGTSSSEGLSGESGSLR